MDPNNQANQSQNPAAETPVQGQPPVNANPAPQAPAAGQAPENHESVGEKIMNMIMFWKKDKAPEQPQNPQGPASPTPPQTPPQT